MTENIAYSTNGEDFYEEFCDISYDLEEGSIYYEGEQMYIAPENCISSYDVDSFLENLDCGLYDSIHAEEIDDCFQDVSKEAKEELLDLVKEWAGKHVKIPYWNVTNVVEKVATKEDLE